jgi:ABC-type transporter Mla subunit MlaD
MEAEARYTFVGASVLLLVAALVAGVLWMNHIGGGGSFARYAIHFERQALDGLEIGADVTLRGIKVGRVEDYALATDTVNRVRVAIRVDRRAQVRNNTVAVVTRNFVTGIAAIALVNPGPPGAPLTAVPEGESLPVVAEGRSDLDEIAGRVNQLGEMASVALSNVNPLLSVDNRQAMMDTVRNLRDVSAGLKARLGALDASLAQVSRAATELGQGATTLARSGERIAGVAERSGAQLDTTLAEADRALKRLAQASAAVEQQAVATARRLEDSAASVDDQLAAAVAELRVSVESATRVLDRLREPRSALVGPAKSQLGPGESLP